jgi:hypothetical protein
MNLNIKIFLLCPVPDDQKPIQEYISFQKNNLINWISFSTPKYRTKILYLFFVFLIGFTFLEIFNSISNFSIIPFIGKMCSLSLIFVSVYLLIGFFLWKQLQTKLNEPRLFYEEASWFDGQIWEKPSLILKNDRLLSSQKIQPFLYRISKNLVQLIFLVICLRFFDFL